MASICLDEIPILINGKLRVKLQVCSDIDKPSLQALALTDERVRPFLDGKQVRKVIAVPGLLVNIVVAHR